MEHDRQYYAKWNRRHVPVVQNRSLIIFVFLFITCQLAATSISVVTATVVVDSESKNSDVPFEEDKSSEVQDTDFDQNTSFSSYDQEEKGKSVTGKTIDDTDEGLIAVEVTEDSDITEEPDGYISDNSLEISSNDNEIHEAQDIGIAEGSDTSGKDDEDASNASIDTSNGNGMHEEIEIGIIEDFNTSEEADGDETSKLSDPSSNDYAIDDDIEKAPKEVEMDAENYTEESTIENRTRQTEKTMALEDERDNGMEDESINKLLIEQKDDDTQNSESSDPSLNDNRSHNDIKMTEVEVEEDTEKFNIENELHEMEKTTAPEDERNNDMEESIIQKDDEPQNSILPSLDDKIEDKEVQNDAGMGATDMNHEGGNEEDKISSQTSSEETQSQINIEDDVETHERSLEDEDEDEDNTAPDSPSESTTKLQLESIETKQEMDRSGNTNETVEAPTNDKPSLDVKSSMMNETDKISEKLSVPNDGIDDDESVIDLDVDPKISQAKNNQGDKIDQNNAQSVSVEIDIEEDKTNVVNNETLRVEVQSTIETSNDTARDEVHSTKSGNSYRGEPWGQYRSTRRLPDLELLRLLFENANKTSRKRTSGDVKSQNVIHNWQKDPLYDENMTIEGLSQEPILVDEHDQSFLNYRLRLLGGDNDGIASANPDSKSKQLVDNPQENANKSDENNGKSNTADVNSEFVEGIDDIANFFEGVDPPDELDVGYGSSIQDVLMDKGKHILLKKARGMARWIQLGWQTMCSKLKDRISEVKFPFQKTEDIKNTSSDMDVVEIDSLNSRTSNKHHKQTLANIREAIVFAFKTGKEIYEKTSDFVDRILDRFDGRIDEDSTNFEDFNGFDLENLSTFSPP